MVQQVQVHHVVPEYPEVLVLPVHQSHHVVLGVQRVRIVRSVLGHRVHLCFPGIRSRPEVL